MSIRSLTSAEKAFLEELKDLNILMHTDGCQVCDSQYAGVICICCADGYHAYDLVGHYRHMAIQNRYEDNDLVRESVHVLSQNGGPLRAISLSPVGSFTRQQMLFADVDAAISLKKGRFVAGTIHLPCGLADLASISIRAQFYLTLAVLKELRGYLKGRGRDTMVKMFFHLALAPTFGCNEVIRQTWQVDMSALEFYFSSRLTVWDLLWLRLASYGIPGIKMPF